MDSVMMVLMSIMVMTYFLIVMNLITMKEIVMYLEEQHKKDHIQTEEYQSTNTEVCDECHGSGQVGEVHCSSCNGRGLI